MKKILSVIALSVTMLATFGLLLRALPANAACSTDPTIKNGVECAAANGTQGQSLTAAFSTVSNVLIFVVGAISVIMIIIGAFRYVLSSGNAAKVESAKNTILYALVGLVLASLSYALVQYVFTRFGI